MEIRSLWWRSEFQSKLLQDFRELEFGPDSERLRNGQIVKCKRTHACILDAESFYAKCPKATLFEASVYLQGWRAGERFAPDSCHTSERLGEDQPSD